MNYCPSCGTANRDGSRFCNECGHKLPSKTGIMCPMCSHINPTANVYCDKCHARLIPASPSSPAEPPPPVMAAAPKADVDPSSMKKGLSLPTRNVSAETPAPTQPEAEPQPRPAPPAEETPDWLARLRTAEPEPAQPGPAPSEFPQPEGEIPYWMRPPASEDSDWFQRLAGSSPATAAPAEPAPQPAEEVLPDWMRDLGIASTDAAASAPVGGEGSDLQSRLSGAPVIPSAEEPLPDWMRGLNIAPSVGAGEPAHEEPDWLARLRAPEPAQADTEAPPQAQAAAPAPDLPDWLKQLDTGTTPPPVGAKPPEFGKNADQADWLSGMRESVPAESQEPTAEVPDWWSNLPSPSGAPTAEPAADVPDWLSALRASAPAEAQEPAAQMPAQAEPPATESEAEPPEWLRGPIETPAEAGAAEPPQTEEPDWLAALRASRAPQPPAEPSAPSEMPDWLAELGAPPAAEAVPATAAFAGEDESMEPAATPDWLTDIDQPAPPVEAAPTQPAQIPAWLRDLGPMPSGAVLAEEAPFGETVPAAPAEIPAWLQEIQPGKAQPAFADEMGQPLAPVSEQPTAGLEAAAIPAWLEALRPREAALQPEAAEAVTETEGLLVGLTHVLPASAFMGESHGAPAVTQAQVPAADLARAGVFQELLARGSLAPPTVKTARLRLGIGERVARWLIAAVLLILVFVVPNSSTIGASVFKLGAVNAGVYAPAANEIASLSEGDRVLMIFDYDASQAGEIDAIAQAFLTHLGQRKAEVIAASLNPIGPILAERVKTKVEDSQLPAPTFVRQGYIPGQAVGVQKVLASTQPGGVKLIVVLTGSSDSLRWWIEQVAASNMRTPVVAGLSAGTLPQAQPYIQSGQVRAAVSGLIAGLAYQRSLDPQLDAGTPAFDRTVRSEALYLSQLAFAAILVAGVIVSLVSRLRPAA